MALYFATVSLPSAAAPGSSLYDALVAHFTRVGQTRVPTLLPPIPAMVAWLRISSGGTVSILGTTESSPYYGPVQLLPAEFPVAAGRNTIDLRGIFFDTGGISVNVAFQVI